MAMKNAVNMESFEMHVTVIAKNQAYNGSNKGVCMYPYDDETEELREKLKDYYGTAMMSGNPMAVIDLSRVENMDEQQLREEAEKNHIK